MTASTYMSLFERRVKLVQDALTEHSKLGDKSARDLALRVLSALDHIPERVR